jgi:hypothetical protein
MGEVSSKTDDTVMLSTAYGPVQCRCRRVASVQVCCDVVLQRHRLGEVVGPRLASMACAASYVRLDSWLAGHHGAPVELHAWPGAGVTWNTVNALIHGHIAQPNVLA